MILLLIHLFICLFIFINDLEFLGTFPSLLALFLHVQSSFRGEAQSDPMCIGLK